MTEDLDIKFERIDGVFDDPLEMATFARLYLQLGDRFISRCAGRTGTRDYLKLPLHQLASGIAENWWTLLYEPWRPEEATEQRIARHHLDAFVPGFVFPSFGIWSAGNDAITVETGRVRRLSPAPDRPVLPSEREIATRLGSSRPVDPRSLSRIELVDENRDRVSVSRQHVESQLFELVSSVIDWIVADQPSLEASALLERWTSVLRSIDDPGERNYCTAAGRLGFDPYDPETPDISVYAAELPEDSFDDLCDAARFDELASASAWVSREQSTLEQASITDVADFGPRPVLDPRLPAWQSGYRAATLLRRQLSLDEDPLKATRRLIGDSGETLSGEVPAVVEGLLVREGSKVHKRVLARSSAQRRFRECRAAFLGWGAEPGDYPLLTTASTHRQQASRAFAAELLCPADYLRHTAGHHGLTTDNILDIAEMLDCQATVVEHQARNHDIPVRGLY